MGSSLDFWDMLIFATPLLKTKISPNFSKMMTVTLFLNQTMWNILRCPKALREISCKLYYEDKYFLIDQYLIHLQVTSDIAQIANTQNTNGSRTNENQHSSDGEVKE